MTGRRGLTSLDEVLDGRDAEPKPIEKQMEFKKNPARAAVVLALAAFSFAENGSAEVTEPNGIRVPSPTSSGGNETSLQAYFDSRGEGIDAAAEASENPGVFSPLCNFTATLVLSASNAAAGLAWYNVPASPTAAPDALYPILAETANVTGAVVDAADIRSSANYAGGYVGFALTKFGGTGIYYSEHQRNAYCTTCSAPGHWKMMLAYPSKVHPNSYYIAFEDWEGANQETWFGNDGDFNDKVFFVTGVNCPGGGEPCDTGKPGLCSAGLTECSFMGTPECKQQHPATAEACDNVDNDCNGHVDEGDLCSSGQVCVRGKCVGRCSGGEFRCPLPLVCGEDGFCIEAECAGVSCGAGLACRGGKCVGACQGIVCPLGQECILDRCVDLCAAVTCAAGTFCERGVCVGDCTCSGCPSGKACAGDGQCVTSGCENVSCDSAQACREGACVDRCDGAVCPGFAACMSGTCAEPVPTEGSGGAATGGNAPGGGIVIISAGGTAGSKSNGGTGASSGDAGASVNGPIPGPGGPVSGPVVSQGCGCTVPGERRPPLSGLALFGLALFWARRRSRSTMEA